MKIKSLVILLVLLALSIIVVSLYACPPAVVADLDAFRTHVILGKPVILDGSGSYTEGTATIAEYAWDFNYEYSSFTYTETPSSHSDGAFDGITTHVYESIGDYIILLRVKDSTTLSSTEEKYVTVSVDNDNGGVGDKLPDSWETLYSVSDPTADDDTVPDGYNNLCEYLHGSDPTDGQSIPARNITIYVPEDFSTIQAAIDVACHGDTIIVAEGTYAENISTNGKMVMLKSSDLFPVSRNGTV